MHATKIDQKCTGQKLKAVYDEMFRPLFQHMVAYGHLGYNGRLVLINAAEPGYDQQNMEVPKF